MKTYVVTDNEIRNITLANGVAGLCFSFMSGLWGYAVSMNTQVMLDPTAKTNAAMMMWVNNIGPLCIYGGGLFAVFGLAVLLWRHFMINLIKQESAMNNTLKIGGRKQRIRPEIPKSDYCDEISPEAWQKLRALVADINDPNYKRESVNGVDIFANE